MGYLRGPEGPQINPNKRYRITNATVVELDLSVVVGAKVYGLRRHNVRRPMVSVALVWSGIPPLDKCDVGLASPL